MRQEDYLKTVIYKGKMINIGIDDNGQSFYIEFEENGDLIEESCGTYCSYEIYLEERFGGCRNCKYYSIESKDRERHFSCLKLNRELEFYETLAPICEDQLWEKKENINE